MAVVKITDVYIAIVKMADIKMIVNMYDSKIVGDKTTDATIANVEVADVGLADVQTE